MSAPPPTSSPSPPANSTSPPPATPASPPPASPTPPASSPPPAVSSSSPPPPPPAATPPSTSQPSPPPPAATPPTENSPPSLPQPPTTTPSPPQGGSPSPPSSGGNPTPSPPSGGNSPSPPSGGNSPSPPSGGNSPSPPSSGNSPSPPSGGNSPSPPSSGNLPSPPSGGNSPSPPSSDGGGGGGISTGTVVGLAVGGVLILAILSIVFICCFKKKKRRRDDGHANYYVPPPPGPKVDPYGGQMHHWQQSAPPPSDHVVNVPPKLTPPPGGAGRPPFPPPGLPSVSPQPYSSSIGSGSNYSGGESHPSPSPGMAFGLSKSTFTYEELALATDGFSQANLLGQGGFGYVHRGVLPNAKEVAVKQLKAGSGQGEREFQAEVEIISRVHHKHLVSLVGYCIMGSERMLVYEFVPNNTLEFHLHAKGRPTVDWHTRLKIALGSAKGLAYLHEDCHPKIIHRDIKAANILLDFNFEAKVADFGLAKLTSDANTHVSTRVMGTFGYLAPEYAASGKLTEKSDVFSFGVVLLELLTGRRPIDSNPSFMDDSLVEWARPLLTRALEENNFDAVVDERLGHNYIPNEMARMVACAAACVRHSARRRPRMSQVVRALEGDMSLSDLNEGIRPGHSTVYSSHGSSDYDTAQYNEDMKRFRKMALSSQTYASSDYSGGVPTSEYGLNASGSSSEALTTTRETETGRKNNKDSQGFSGGGGY